MQEIVETRSDSVSGVNEGAVTRFSGIPYAAAKGPRRPWPGCACADRSWLGAGGRLSGAQDLYGERSSRLILLVTREACERVADGPVPLQFDTA